MGLHSGGLIIGRIFASEILGSLFSGGPIFGGAYYRKCICIGLISESCEIRVNKYVNDGMANLKGAIELLSYKHSPRFTPSTDFPAV